jgi:hypothetical protein
MKKKRLLTDRGEFEMTTDMWEKSEIVRLLQGAPGTHYQEADDTNKAIMRDWVRSLLQKGTITVTTELCPSVSLLLMMLAKELTPASDFASTNSYGTLVKSRVHRIIHRRIAPRKGCYSPTYSQHYVGQCEGKNRLVSKVNGCE